MATPPGSDEQPPDRRTLEDVPPFLSWRAIYALVVGALAVQVVVYAVLSRVMR
jgi:hypothetical protein